MPKPDFDDFWHWVLSRYSLPGFPDRLLALQDENDQVVMEVLLALWLLEQGRLPRPLDDAGWLAGTFVAQLRQLRRAGKSAVDAGLLSATTYHQLLQLEVDAERLLARALYDAAMPAPKRPSGREPVELLAEALPGAPAIHLQALLEALESSGNR